MFLPLERKRLMLYLGLAFGIAWAVALVIALTGGLTNSPLLVPEFGITLALVLLSLGYMWAPALAHLLTRVITAEGWQGTGLRLGLRRGWRYYLAAWLVPALMTLLGALVYFLVFPGQFSTMQVDMLSAQGLSSPWLFVAGQVLLTVLFVPLVNGPFAFGEEFGWRGYMLPKLRPLGARRAMLASGAIWGVWHWPVILMGHNYGLSYPGAPWLGLLAMVWMTFVLGTFLNWLTLHSRSVWPATIAHGAVNGIAGLPVLFLAQQPNMVIGPTLAGVLGSIGFAALALYLMLNPARLAPRHVEEIAPVPAQPASPESFPQS